MSSAAGPHPGGEPPEAAPELVEELRALTREVGELRDDVQRLSAARAAVLPDVEYGWVSEEPSPRHIPADAHAWVGTLEPPLRRSPRVPRFLLEVIVLVAAAVLAAVAGLEPAWVIAVMAAAFAVVALVELAAWGAERRAARRLAGPAAPSPLAPDVAWYAPPVERTVVQGGAGLPVDEQTGVTQLPRSGTADEATVEARPSAGEA